MEGADEILAVRGIDGGLAADRRIDLRQQCRRHLHVIDAATHDRRGEAGEIADDAAAERDNKIAALDAFGDQRLADPFEAVKALRTLADRNDHAARRDAGRGQRGFGGAEMVARDFFVGDDRDLRTRTKRGDARAERTDQAASDDDVVAARIERDLDDCRIGAEGRGHTPAFSCGDGVSFRNESSAVRISATITSCATSRDCTVRSASA